MSVKNKIVLEFYLKKCATFSGSGVNANLAKSRAIVQSCLDGYFVGPVVFLVRMSFVQDFFL